jgi:uncharacterized membrane protein
LGAEPETSLLLWTGRGASAIEALAVAIIVFSIFLATALWLYHTLRRRHFEQTDYEAYRAQLGRALLLGLEILVAADIVRTVTTEPSLRSIASLGLLVLVRTFLSWSIVVEIEGRWPWQDRPQRGAGQARPAGG